MMCNKKITFRIVNEFGEPCHTCNRPTQTREHLEITNKQLQQPFYYSRWYNCTNPECKTTLIMPDEFRVYNNNEASRAYFTAHQEWKERQEALSHLRSI